MNANPKLLIFGFERNKSGTAVPLQTYYGAKSDRTGLLKIAGFPHRAAECENQCAEKEKENVQLQ